MNHVSSSNIFVLPPLFSSIIKNHPFPHQLPIELSIVIQYQYYPQIVIDNLISMMISISYYYSCYYPLIVPITQHNLPRYPYHPMQTIHSKGLLDHLYSSTIIQCGTMAVIIIQYYPILSIIYPTLFSINISLSRSNMINYHQLSKDLILIYWGNKYHIKWGNKDILIYLKCSLPHFSKTPFGVPLGMSFTSAASINGSAWILQRDAPSVARQALRRALCAVVNGILIVVNSG